MLSFSVSSFSVSHRSRQPLDHSRHWLQAPYLLCPALVLFPPALCLWAVGHAGHALREPLSSNGCDGRRRRRKARVLLQAQTAHSDAPKRCRESESRWRTLRGVRPAASIVSLVMWRSGLRQSESLAGVSWRAANTVGRPCGVRRPSAETPEPESKENAEADEVREGIEGGSRKATLSFQQATGVRANLP